MMKYSAGNSFRAMLFKVNAGVFRLIQRQSLIFSSISYPGNNKIYEISNGKYAVPMDSKKGEMVSKMK